MKTNEELVTAIQNGKRELMDQLWQQCYGFIRQQAIKWAIAWENRPSFDEDDLTQAGYIALCEAVRGFQSNRGTFIGFLAYHLKTEFSKVAGCRTEAQRKEPLNCAMSLDAPAFNDPDSETALGENIPVSEQGFEDVEEALFIEQVAPVLDKAMQSLPENQRRAIELYYLHRKTYIQIAEILHCSNSSTRQLLKNGLNRLKMGSFAPVLSEVLYGDRNYYRGTGFNSWKYTGSSSPERELLRKEYKMRGRTLECCVQHLGMTTEQAKRLFPA